MATELGKDWYIREWMEHLGKRQADLVRDRGWLKGRVSKFLNGEHQYRRDIVNELAAWLGIEPYELLVHPKEAAAMRRLRETALLIAAEQGVPFERDDARHTVVGR